MRKSILIITLIFVVVFAIGITIINRLGNEKLNVLIYGIDESNGDVERSDAIILANYNFEKNQIVITSIPRDSYVKISCKNNKYDKINHAYAYGKENCLNKTVSDLFGITNLKNILFDFQSVTELIDFFGFIEVIPSHSFCQISDDGNLNYCFEKDKKILADGKQVLAYMRARKSLPNGDFDRIKNQRQIMKILINSISEKERLFFSRSFVVKL